MIFETFERKHIFIDFTIALGEVLVSSIMSGVLTIDCI